MDSKIENQNPSRPRWLAFIEDEPTREILSYLALKDGLPTNCVQPGGIERARTYISGGVVPQLLILDLSSVTDLINIVKSFIETMPPTMRMIVLGKDDHVSIYRELTHLGVADYVLLPVAQNALYDAISEVLSRSVLAPAAESVAVKLKPFTVILGTRGGVGATTVAVNMAGIAFELQQRVCLLDLDFYFGNICLLLDLAQNKGLNEALAEVDRVDELYLKRLLLLKDAKFAILAGQLTLDQEMKFSADAFKGLITLLRDKFDYIYADMPVNFNNPISNTVLSLADNVIIVTELSLIAVQDVLRIKAYIKEFAPQVKFKLVTNSTSSLNGRSVTKGMFEKAVDSTVDLELPFCKGSILEAIDAGQPFAKLYPKHAFSQQLRDFTEKLYPSLHVEKKKPFSLGSLFRKDNV